MILDDVDFGVDQELGGSTWADHPEKQFKCIMARAR